MRIVNQPQARILNATEDTLEIELVVRAQPGQRVRVEVVMAPPIPILIPAPDPLDGVRFRDLTPSHLVRVSPPIEDAEDQAQEDAEDQAQEDAEDQAQEDDQLHSITLNTREGEIESPPIFDSTGSIRVIDRAAPGGSSGDEFGQGRSGGQLPFAGERGVDMRIAPADQDDVVIKAGHWRETDFGGVWVDEHETAARHRCGKCGVAGHKSSTCGRLDVQPDFTPTTTQRCSRCGVRGHTLPRCPHDMDAPRCDRCHLAGHAVEDCPKPEPGRPRCSICGQEGHNSRTCPLADAPRCSVCNLAGHNRRTCPQGVNA